MNKIGDYGSDSVVISIKKLNKISSLTLDLSRNDITDAGADLL